MKRRLPWWLGGILMALLLLFTFSIFGGNRPLGASTYVPYYAGILFGMHPADYTYLTKVENPGAWEGVMLLGTFLGGLVTSIFITKTFRFTIMPTGWKVYKNNSVLSRVIWSFFAGFFLILGARLAGGCTSGHILSGMTQTAFSSMIFGASVIITLLITGKLFYKKGETK